MRNRTEGRAARRIGEFIEFPDVMQNWYPAQSLPDVPEVDPLSGVPELPHRDETLVRVDAAAAALKIPVHVAESLARKIPGTHGGAFVALDVLRAAAREAGYHPRRPDLRRYGVLEGVLV